MTTSGPPEPGLADLPLDALRDRLARWVASGLIDPAQAARIEAAEVSMVGTRPGAAGPPGPAADRNGRGALVVEALGYLGAVLAAIASVFVVDALWPEIPTGAQLGLSAIAAVVFAGTGAALRVGDVAAFGRLRAAVWLLSTAAVAAFVGFLGDEVLDLRMRDVALLTTAVTTGYAMVLWWFHRTSVQLVALYLAGAGTVAAAVIRLDPHDRSWLWGFAVWVFSVLWGFAVRLGYLRPRTTGYVLAAGGAVVGALATMDHGAGHVLAAATVATLLAGGVAQRRVWALIMGAVGVLVVVPITATRYLPESVGVPLAILAVGVVLLGVALWLALRPGARRSAA